MTGGHRRRHIERTPTRLGAEGSVAREAFPEEGPARKRRTAHSRARVARPRALASDPSTRSIPWFVTRIRKSVNLGDVTDSTTHRRKTNRPSHLDMVCEVLGVAPGHTLTRDELFERLNARYTPWDRADFDSRLDRFVADDHCPIASLRGRGSKVRWTGSERGGGPMGSGLHNAVVSSLLVHGIPQTRCAERQVHLTANRRSGEGRIWVIPDVVVAGRASGQDVVHTFEVEPEAGFSIVSVYQAHAQGLGADYSWVLFDRGARAASDLSTVRNERIEWAARELGIGLISFSKPTVRDTWIVIRKPTRRPHTKAQVDELSAHWAS